MKKSTITVNKMVEMCMYRMCMIGCVSFSDTISVSEVDHCAA